MEENSILLVCAAKVRFFKQQDADHERDTDQPSFTRTEYAIHPENTQENKHSVAFFTNSSVYSENVEDIARSVFRT